MATRDAVPPRRNLPDRDPRRRVAPRDERSRTAPIDRGARTEPTSRSARTTPARSTPARSTPARSTPARSTPARSTPARSTPARTNPGRTDADRSAPGRSRTEPGRRGTASRPLPARGRTAGDPARVVSRPAPAPVRRRKPKSVRGRRVTRSSAARVNQRARHRSALVVLLALLGVALTKLVLIQTVDAQAYAAAGDSQRQRTVELPAQRGQITDRTGALMAFSIEGRRLAVRPQVFADDVQRRQIADIVMAGLQGTTADGSITRTALLTKMSSTKKYVYVVDGLTPTQADKILAAAYDVLTDKNGRLAALRGSKLTPKQKDAALNALVPERQDIRTYPAQGIAEPIVGSVGWDGQGLGGIESRYNSTLAGVAGARESDFDASGRPIPGTVTGETPATDGTSLQLTIDADTQYMGQQMLCQKVKEMAAKGGNMVVREVKTGKVVVMTSCVPGKSAAEVGNQSITAPVEPGSVNKVVTFAAALEAGLITPTTPMTVDGRITMNGTTVGDAWPHGPIEMSATGVLAKSSNVGTLMLAHKVGEQKFYDLIRKFGIGSKTGIELNGETAGILPEWNADPAKSQWSASTFANMPIGQGVAMTVLQLADMYQTIANGGVRLPPTVIQATIADGATTTAAVGAGTRVISKKTADTLRTMLTATMQDGDQAHRGTAPAAAIAGYQVGGKTGTAQQVDPGTKAYSNSLYTTTFAGFLPADDPQYVIAISLDRPGGDREGGTSAAPLFHDFGAYLMDAMNVPPSASPAPVRALYLGTGG